MNTMVDDIETTTSQLRSEIRSADWGVTGRTLDEVAGLVVEALLQVDDDGVMRANNAIASAYADLVATQEVGPSAGPQGLADQMVGLSRVFTAALRKRRTLTESEASLIIEDLSIRILRALRASNRPVSNVDLAAKVKCRQETIARRMPQLRQAQLVRSWPAGRSMFNEITDLGREALSGQGSINPARSSYVEQLRKLDREFSAGMPAKQLPNVTSPAKNVITTVRSRDSSELSKVKQQTREYLRTHSQPTPGRSHEVALQEKQLLISALGMQSDENDHILFDHTAA